MTNRIDFKLQVVNHDWGGHLWSESQVWLRFRVTAQWGGTPGSHNLSHPEAGGEPSALSKRSARYHNQLLVMNTGHQRCIQANERAAFGPHPLSNRRPGILQLFSYGMWQVACSVWKKNVNTKIASKRSGHCILIKQEWDFLIPTALSLIIVQLNDDDAAFNCTDIWPISSRS